MSSDQNALASAVARVDETSLSALQKPRAESTRHHVLMQNMQSRAGRLYCYEETDFDVPALELYAAR